MDDDDDLQIHTSNQNEKTRDLVEKKKKIAEKIFKKDPKSKNGLKDSTLKKKKLGTIKKKTLKDVTIKEKSADHDTTSDTTNNLDDNSPHSEKPQNHYSNTGGAKSSSKMAKFSSLFKNNAAIPVVGNVEAKEAQSLEENLFSKSSFANMEALLSPHLIDCLQKRFKLKKMTQIQEKTIPAVLSGRDCFVKSQTGSGKTLAYAIPVIQSLQSREPRIKRTDGIRVLVLVPTRELAVQTCEVFEKLCNACVWLVSGALIGGMKKKSEKDRIRRGLNVLIATPGRLCDHLDTTMALDLSRVEYLIFDEADRMLDLDFEKKINFIIFKLHSARKKFLSEPVIPMYKLDPSTGEPVEIPTVCNGHPIHSKRMDPQTILISATLTSGIKEIARRLNIADALNIDAVVSNKKTNGKEEEEEEESEEEPMIINGKRNNEAVTLRNAAVNEKISLPAGLSHFYVIVPSKLRLIGLLSFILEKIVYKLDLKVNKLVIFAATNDSVQFHEIILRTFLNRKFNMYLDDDEDEYDEDAYLRRQSTKTSSTKDNCEVFSLYGNMDQHKRVETLGKFCKTKAGVLICTDVAARGLDMPNVDWIIQYNTPGSCVDYVHRVGRTARVGHKGKAIIFLEPCEVEYLKELNNLGISLKEQKLDTIMECLNDEVKHYPRQINSDRLVLAKNAEECANSMQFYIEEFVEKSTETHTLARKAYLSFLRSYSTFSTDMKRIFHVKNLHVGHVAKSFGLREAPSEIVGNELKLFKGSRHNQQTPSRGNSNFNRNNGTYNNNGEEDFDKEYDKLESKYARDLKRITNGHKEYGNVLKKNKAKSQKLAIDLTGLLKNQKVISEYSSGLDSKKDNTNANSSFFSKNANVEVNRKRAFTSSISSSEQQGQTESALTTNKKTNAKIPKRNMSVFD